MEILGHIWFAAVCSVIALKPGPLELRGAFSKGPWHTVERRNELVIRAVALTIGVLIWIDLVLILTGGPRLLR